MKIILEGLPRDITTEDTAKLLAVYVEVLDQQIYTSHTGDFSTVWVTIAGTHTEANRAVKRLNGLYWREHILKAYVSLFSDNR